MKKGTRKTPQPRDLTPFGYWVKHQLVDRNMTSAELSRRVGCNEVLLSRILHGDTPGTKYLEQIKNELKLSKAKGA